MCVYVCLRMFMYVYACMYVYVCMYVCSVAKLLELQVVLICIMPPTLSWKPDSPANQKMDAYRDRYVSPSDAYIDCYGNHAGENSIDWTWWAGQR